MRLVPEEEALARMRGQPLSRGVLFFLKGSAYGLNGDRDWVSVLSVHHPVSMLHQLLLSPIPVCLRIATCREEAGRGGAAEVRPGLHDCEREAGEGMREKSRRPRAMADPIASMHRALPRIAIAPLPVGQVRPGGLKSELKSGEAAGNIVMRGPGYWGVPPKEPRAGSILRRQVSACLVRGQFVQASNLKKCTNVGNHRPLARYIVHTLHILYTSKIF